MNKNIEFMNILLDFLKSQRLRGDEEQLRNDIYEFVSEVYSENYKKDSEEIKAHIPIMLYTTIKYMIYKGEGRRCIYIDVSGNELIYDIFYKIYSESIKSLESIFKFTGLAVPENTNGFYKFYLVLCYD